MKLTWHHSILLLGLWGCDAITPDTAGLTARTLQPVDRPRCDACHGFAPRTGAHRFHLISSDFKAQSCEDCHAASIAMKGPVFDSVWSKVVRDGKGTGDSTIYLSNNSVPWDNTFSRVGLTYESDLSGPKDSVPWKLAERRAGMEFPEWLVRPSSKPEIPGHGNGKVDVVIAQTHWSRGDFAHWDPVKMTCSSVKCHNDEAKSYSWKEPTP